MRLQNVTYNDHSLQAIEFTGEESVQEMDTVFGEEFMDRSETDESCKTLFLYSKSGRVRSARYGDYVMRTAGGKLFICRWREFRAMYASARAA